jgi:hypothetical protein
MPAVCGLVGCRHPTDAVRPPRPAGDGAAVEVLGEYCRDRDREGPPEHIAASCAQMATSGTSPRGVSFFADERSGFVSGQSSTRRSGRIASRP